jgi:inner membrane transporter RhtA
MTSIQSGASLAKSLFPVVGAPGVTALRLALGTLILVVVFKPWRLRFSRRSACRCCCTAWRSGR